MTTGKRRGSNRKTTERQPEVTGKASGAAVERQWESNQKATKNNRKAAERSGGSSEMKNPGCSRSRNF